MAAALALSLGLPARADLAAAVVADQSGTPIGPGDQLQLDFLDDDAEPYPLPVGADGAVQLPLLGALHVAGEPVEAARAAIADLYVAREILVEPRLELSVLTPRPVYVVGDVREPGEVDYRPFLTVEQAIALVGGPRSELDSEEGRSLQRASLRAELIAAEGSIAQSVVAAARLRAQLAQADRIRPEDIDLAEVAIDERPMIDALRAQEDEILTAERENYLAQRNRFQQSIAQGRAEVELTREQIAAQIEQVGSYDEELDRSTSLSEDGIISATALTRLEREIADQRSRLLQLRSNLASSQRVLAGLERETADLSFQREQSWRVDLVQAQVDVVRLRAVRDSILERLALLDEGSARAAEGEARRRTEYLIRRRGADGALATVAAAPTDELRPGDTLVLQSALAPSLALADAAP